MQTYKRLLFLLNIYDRKRAGLIVILIFIMAFLDMIGVASILPFISVLTNPDFIQSNFILNYVYNFLSVFGVVNNQQFLIILGIFFYVLLVFSLFFKALTAYVQVRFIEMFQFN